MGVCLYFTSAEAVDPQVEQAICADAEGGSRDQPWVLCEPPHFYPIEDDGRLRGGSKLNLHPHPDEFAEAEEVEVMRNDLQELIHRLCEWSWRHSLTWELTVEGDRIGVIREGICEEGVMGAVEVMAEMAEELGRMSPDKLFGSGDAASGDTPSRPWC
jgi:hypothetical protein